MDWMSRDVIALAAIVLLPIIPALVLFALLPSRGEVSGPFKKLQWKFSGAFVGYLFVFLALIPIRPKEIPNRYDTWTLDGRVVFEHGPDEPAPDAQDIKVRLTPPDLVVHGDRAGGAFSFEIPVPVKEASPAFPNLSLDLPGYEPVFVSLSPDDAGDGSNITVGRDQTRRRLTVQGITLRSRAGGAKYDEKKAQTAELRPGGSQ